MIAIDEKTRSVATLVSSVLFRATILGFGLLLLSTIPIVLFTDEIYAIHRNWFEIPRAEYEALLFGYLAHMKILVLILFLIPAVAIRWALESTLKRTTATNEGTI